MSTDRATDLIARAIATKELAVAPDAWDLLTERERRAFRRRASDLAIGLDALGLLS